MKTLLHNWLASMSNRPGGDILAVQTLRNAIMAASVLASAAMVAVMGVLATAHMHPRMYAIAAALMLAISAAAAMLAIVRLARAGFEFQLASAAHEELGADLLVSLRAIAVSATLLALALFVAGLSLLA
jgi:Protein of unknown function, DUF599